MLKILTYNLFGVKKAKNYFTERLEPLQRLILEEDADIVCLQEAHPEQVGLLLERYELCWTLKEALLQDIPDRTGYTEEEEEFLKTYGIIVILIKKNCGFRAVEKRLVFEGDNIDTGAICVKLQRTEPSATTTITTSPASSLPFDTLFVYNCHWTGGSYGLDEVELQHRREFRVRQYQMLKEDLQKTTAATATPDSTAFLIAGDFNSDPDQLHEFPEAAQAIERNTGKNENDDNSYTFTDLWKVFVGDGDDSSSSSPSFGATESTSLNRFRAYLKPKQRREVRFDRILWGCPNTTTPKQQLLSPTNVLARLVGATQATEITKTDNNNIREEQAVPVFPSDHFGVSATISFA